MPSEEHRTELGPLQIVVLILSLFLLTALAAELVLPVPREVARVIGFIDTAVCAIFFIDFVHRFHGARSKLQFMKWGWIDLLASIPVIDSLRWGRLFRIFRIVRLLLAVHSFRQLLALLFASRTRAGVASVFVLTFVIVSFSAIGILLCEAGRGNIKTAGDAIWWSFVTITTIGYGDFYPVTVAGRAVAVITMFAGVGIFGAMSGVVASVLLGSDKQGTEDLVTEVRALRGEIARLHESRPPPPPGA
jgi:voltage-gated potassium channel